MMKKQREQIKYLKTQLKNWRGINTTIFKKRCFAAHMSV